MLGGADAVGDRFVQPTVLIDVPEDSTAITEETFGPTLTITKVNGHGRGRRGAPTPPGTVSAATVFSRRAAWSWPAGSGPG